MAVKNFWSFNPGETIVAEALQDKFKDKIELYFPLRDTGIDLLAVVRDTKKVIAFQVKESRYYENGKGSAWHQEHQKKFLRNKDKVDFYVFVIYLPAYLDSAMGKKDKFVIHYIIVPTEEVLKRIKYKTANKAGVYSFYFRIEEKKVIEVRESNHKREANAEVFDYTEYYDNWGLIKESIGAK